VNLPTVEWNFYGLSSSSMLVTKKLKNFGELDLSIGEAT